MATSHARPGCLQQQRYSNRHGNVAHCCSSLGLSRSRKLAVVRAGDEDAAGTKQETLEALDALLQAGGRHWPILSSMRRDASVKDKGAMQQTHIDAVVPPEHGFAPLPGHQARAMQCLPADAICMLLHRASASSGHLEPTSAASCCWQQPQQGKHNASKLHVAEFTYSCTPLHMIPPHFTHHPPTVCPLCRRASSSRAGSGAVVEDQAQAERATTAGAAAPARRGGALCDRPGAVLLQSAQRAQHSSRRGAGPAPGEAMLCGGGGGSDRAHGCRHSRPAKRALFDSCLLVTAADAVCHGLVTPLLLCSC
jgi:hypothetical protein